MNIKTNQKTRSFVIATLLFILGGCQSYEAQPLKNTEILKLVDSTRSKRPIPGKSLTFRTATEHFTRSSPAVVSNNTGVLVPIALSEIAIPFPNPSLSAGVQYGIGPPVDHSYQFGPSFGLGFTLPLTNRLEIADERNDKAAVLAKVTALTQFYQLWFELRARFLRASLAKRKLRLTEELNKFVLKTEETGKLLARAGQTTRIDVAQLRLATQRSRYQIFQAKQQSRNRSYELARLLGVKLNPDCSLEGLASLDQDIPGRLKLRRLLVKYSPSLCQLRARYQLAEKQLEHEIILQYPDLQIGTGLDQEAGENRTGIGLSFTIPLPFFDRNQVKIAQARALRDSLRQTYIAEVNRQLSRLEQARHQLSVTRDQHHFIKTIMIPMAEKNVGLAKQALRAGNSTAIQFLDSIRSVYHLKIEVLQRRLDYGQAWIDLEKIIGHPILQLTPDTVTSLPTPPAALKIRDVEKLLKSKNHE